MEKIISVIIPVYNQVRYLKDCINSLLIQLTDDIEILLILQNKRLFRTWENPKILYPGIGKSQRGERNI